MSRISILKKNYIYQSAYQVLSIALPLLTAPYIARVLGADGIGVYSYVYSIAYYFMIIAKLGIENYGNRCIASVRDNKNKLSQTFSDIYALHFIIGAVVLTVYIFGVLLAGGKYKEELLIMSFFILGQIWDINWFYFGIEKFKLTVIRNFIIKILMALCVFIFVKKREDLWKYILIMASGAAIGELATWPFLREFIQPVKPDLHSFRRHIASLLLLFIPSIAVSVYKVMDKIMLGAISNTAQTGLYENAEKIISACLGFVTALGAVMMPRMTNLIANKRGEECERLIERSARYILALSYAMCFGIIGISNVFPIVFWGEEFRDCNLLLVGLAASLPFIAIANVVRTQYLIPRHKDKEYIIAVWTGAAVNFVANWQLIPRWNAWGAVIGTLIAEIIVCMLQMAASQRDVKVWKYIIDSMPFLFIGVIMAWVTHLIGKLMGVGVLTLLIQISVGVILYCGAALAYLKMTGDESINGVLKGKHKRKSRPKSRRCTEL